MDSAMDWEQADTDEDSGTDAATSTTQSNRGAPAIDQRFSAVGNISAFRLSRRDLDSLRLQVCSAFQADSPEEVQALLSGRHPGDVKEVLQYSSHYRGRFTLLTRAALEGNLIMVRALVEVGADVNHINGFRETALQLAFSQSNFEMAKLLIEKGARLDPLDAKRNFYLTKALKENAVEIVMYLLDNGADPNEETQEWGIGTPLREATRLGNLDMVKLLVAKGADVNHADTIDTTPLHIACALNRPDIAKYLVEKGARTDAGDWRGCTCLMEACMSKGMEVARFLLDAGVDPNQKTLCKRTALHLCAEEGALEATKLLVTKGADVNLTDYRNCTALLIACNCDYVKIVQYLLDSGSRTDITDKEDKNCLMMACRAGSIAVVKLLLERGMDPNYKSLSHKTPLHEAAVSKSTEVAELLLEHGALSSADIAGHTPLVDAAFHHSVDIAEILLESSSLKRVEKAEALELLAASCVQSSLEEAYEHLHRAMEVRHSDPSDVLLKPHRPPVSALGNVVESQTLEELESRIQNQATLQWECLLAVERILGSHDCYVHDYFMGTCYDLCQHQRFRETLALWTYLMKFPNTDDLVSDDFLMEVLLISYSPTFKETEEVLRAALLRMPPLRSLKVLTCLKYVKSAFQVATDGDERNQLQTLVQGLIAAQSTGNQKMTLLHYAASEWSIASRLTEHSAPLVAFLLQCGANVNAANSSGNTPLHLIVQCQDRGRVETVCCITRMLLEAGFHLDLRNNQGDTVLDCAVMEEVRVIVREYWPLPLQCLAATAVLQHGVRYQDGVPQKVQDFISMHKFGQH